VKQCVSAARMPSPSSGGRRFRTHIGACELPDGPIGEVRGYWIDASCSEYNDAVVAAGGLDKLTVWSSLTDLDGQYGSPFIFTCWGEKTEDGHPVAAAGGSPEDRRPCAMDHAVFVPASAP
jgi:hypothetical protein